MSKHEENEENETYKRIKDQWVENELYPEVFEYADQVFPEMQFIMVGGVWRSPLRIDGSLPKNRRQDKSIIHPKIVGAMYEQGHGAISLAKYIQLRDGVSYPKAIHILAGVVGMAIQYEDGTEEKAQGGKTTNKPQEPHKTPKRVFIPDKVQKWLTSVPIERNTLFSFLMQHTKYPIPKDVVKYVFNAYQVGTTPEGHTTFPYIDQEGNIHAIQLVYFDINGSGGNRRTTLKYYLDKWGRQTKEGREIASGWLEEYKKSANYYGQFDCLFGLPLVMKYPDRPVVVVESPKTVLVMAMYQVLQKEGTGSPIFIASYNNGGLTVDRLRVLSGRHVAICPDMNSIEYWESKTEALRNEIPECTFSFVRYWEDYPKDIGGGNDIADYQLQVYWGNRKEREQHPIPNPIQLLIQHLPKTDIDNISYLVQTFHLELDN